MMALAPRKVRQMDKLAQHMADGSPSLTDAAYRMKVAQADVEALWAAIRRGLGWQGR